MIGYGGRRDEKRSEGRDGKRGEEKNGDELRRGLRGLRRKGREGK
jgi:hypothetical protein